MAEALRIALLTHSLHARGGVVHVLELSRALQRRGHAVTVFAPAAPGQRLFRDTPCTLSLAPCSVPAGVALADAVRLRIDALREHLRGVLRARGYDVLHAHDGIGGNALADLWHANIIVGYLRTVHHADRFADERVQAWEERSIRHAARLLAVSGVWRRHLQQATGREVLQVPNGVDLGRYTPQREAADAAVCARLGVHERGPVVLAVGGIEARKNSARLLQAVVQARAVRPGLRLVVAGGQSVLRHDAEVAAFHAAAAHAGLRVGGPGEAQADVLLTGALADAELPPLYRRADVLAMPSLIEGFGLAALEALACGTPAVVSARPPFTEHLQGCAGVQWADPLSAASIAQALLRAVAQGRLPQVPAVCRRYDWAASAERHEALYRLPLPQPLAATLE